jgi:hypothetical protein
VNRHLVTGALLVPALLLSCNDSNENPVSPSATPPNTFTPAPRAAPVNDHLIRLAQPSAAAVAEAAKAELSMAATVTTMHGGNAPHDPTVLGQRVVCFDGDEFGFPPGRADRFLNNHGCEHNTMAGGASITAPLQNFTRGKRVRDIRRLEFFYAGGPQNGGAPRFDIFTDFCRDASGNPVTTETSSTPPCTTDGTWDETLFIDQSGCNDGDVYVGAVRLKSDPNSQTDATCNVTEAYGFDGVAGSGDEHTHPNWAHYVAAHRQDRMARNFGTFAPGLADNFIITDVPVHYLIYRVRMQ